jgi:Strictosidine synthase
MGAQVIGALRSFADNMLGRGEATVTVPSFDGVLKPNQLLETALTVANFDAANDLASDGSALYVADGPVLLRFDGQAAHEIRRFDREITAVCCLWGGRLAVALDGREVRVFPSAAGTAADVSFGETGMNAVNALSAGPVGTLLATDGSRAQPFARWAHDLMEKGRTGRLLSLDPTTRSVREIASGLAFAFGACQAGAEILVSESWRHRVVALSADGRKRAALDNLPAYPSRISPAASGGFWLTAFVARTQLVEFVLRESAYRRRMMKEIAPEFWIAPRLRSGHSFEEPMQGAHIKTMGVIKPWAPPRSYGLVIRLNAQGAPLYSLHSRVDGFNHGVVSAVEADRALYVLAKGPGRLLRLPLAKLEAEMSQ